uniref:Uncharacterized protein n=1 Tax=Nelumbo nucifera TaxID=4432 RepID=A0A822XUS3_NELNU|nr:TPA_asm: hypothetical protein HUJ06_022661 [Nelumbo nucifera]
MIFPYIQFLFNPRLQLRDVDASTFLTELQLNRTYPSCGSDLSTWKVVAEIPFLDRALSLPLCRSFFIPHSWQHKNVFGMYKLLRRIPK